MRTTLRTSGVAVRAMLVFTAVLGVGYMLLITGIGQLALPAQANGSLVRSADGAVIGVVLAAVSLWLPRIFSSDAAVVSAATPALVVAASAMPLAGAVYLFDGVLMGAGDGGYLARAGLLTLVPYLPLVVIVAEGRLADGTAGLVCLWAAFAWVFMGARALTTGLRTRGGAWRS